MLYGSKKTVEDLIVEGLSSEHELKGPDLLALIQKERPSTTKQAMYYALEKLIQDEVVVKAGTLYQISNTWKIKIEKYVIGRSPDADLKSILALQDKEYISMEFPSLLNADAYWAHIFTLLTDWVPAEYPIFAWNPHEWFIVGREEVEREVLNNFKDKDKRAYFSMLGATDLDKDFRNNFASEHLKVNTGSKDLFGYNVYINVFKDILIEVTLPQTLADNMEAFYKSVTGPLKNVSAEKIQAFIQVVSDKHPVKIKVSRNVKKSIEIKKKLAKDFLIPKEYEF